MNWMEVLENPKFWVAVAFVIVVVASYKKVSRLLIGALDARSAKIRAELTEAENLRREAEAVLAEYRRKQAEYTQEAQTLLANSKRDAQAFAKRAEVELQQALAERTRQAMEKISIEEKKAVDEVRNHLVDIALAAARAILTDYVSHLPQEEQAKLALYDIEHKLH